jgi:hypothetical protein
MRRGLALALLLALFAAAGCDRCKGVVCDPCDAPVHLVVTDASTGGPVDGVTVQGAQGPCQVVAASAATECWLSREDATQDPAGTYSLSISAPGHETRTLEVTVSPDASGACCSCGTVTTTLRVTLNPL